jgi:hypothetical protein
MLSQEYLDTARTLLRVAQNMADQIVAERLKAIMDDYQRRAEKAQQVETALAQPTARRERTAVTPS